MMRFTARKRRAVCAVSIMQRASASVVASGFFTEHMLPCVERGDGEFALRRGRCGDVDDLHVVAHGECVDVRADWHDKFLARLARGLRDRVGHGGCSQPGHRGKLAQAEAAKRPAPSSPTPSFERGIIGFERDDVSALLVAPFRDVIMVSWFVHLSFYVRS